MRTALIVAIPLISVIATIGIVTSAAAQSKGAAGQKSGACRSESMDACVKRQMGLRDAVSGVSIQRGDAERFCNRRAQRC